jgi:histidinol-phosphatase
VTAGVVYQPLTQETHTARRGKGAFLNGERIRVSGVATLAKAMLVHPSLTVLRGTLWDGFVRLVDATARQRGFGDFLCYTTIAEGKADLGLGMNLSPWDVAPLAVLVEEAGGRLTDLDGVATIGASRMLASNGRLHEMTLALLRGRPLEAPSP